MKIPKIYISHLHERLPLEEALSWLTDDWVNHGHYCAQTVIDLRDALIYYKEKNSELEKE